MVWVITGCWCRSVSTSSPPPDPRLHAFGLNIRRLRERKGLSLEELAERSELSFRGLVYIEHGRRNAGVLTVFKIADGLELPAAALFDYPPPHAEQTAP
jgi:transcriptional regulator with XRE-family HTH domain